MSNSMTNQNQFEGQELDAAYGSCLRNNPAFTTESIGGVFSIMEPHHHALASGSEMSHTRHLMDLLGAAANESNHHHHNHHQRRPQGLSLSLGSHMIVPSHDEYSRHNSRSFVNGFMNPNNYFIPAQDSRAVENNLTSDYYFNSATTTTTFASSSASFGSESFAALIGNSRYLKPVQSLLEDLVDVGGNVVDRINDKYVEKLFHGGRNSSRTLSSQFRNNINTGVLSAEKQEHQIKIAKLISLLDEVEGRYEKYYHQMEQVVASFEMIAGEGAAKCYTALALQAMARHFCNLRDAIMSQINLEKKKLLQDLPKQLNNGLSQLSLFDRDTSRQSRMSSLQQLGMIQSQRSQQVWRPIRGLPETSVAILRSWLFEHFLHPYPNDSEKLMLASQTGLTKNQVSNWFINARVRLWKPMIEEMYEQEFGDSSEDSNPQPDFTTDDATHCHHHDSN
ncbi:BEL1-like homeodomain protein 11 [Arachis stenosperma]|uniref:BEL1-like homeodomain protein 11 n=1 Tax=Arachis stenosperma TaxID=217475 RepID=UPI0025AB7111|nr:BEL1-like homeodomain protein 11 [Arachis stenosperma]